MKYHLVALFTIFVHMLAASFRSIQARSDALAKQPERQRHHDQSQPSQQMKHKAEHVVGVRKMVEIEHDRGPRGGQPRNGIEQGVEVHGIMTREIQRDCSYKSKHDPRQTRYRKRLLPIQATGLDTQKIADRPQ